MKSSQLALLSMTILIGCFKAHAFAAWSGSGRRLTAVLGYKNSASASYLSSLSTGIMTNNHKVTIDANNPIYLLDEALKSNADAAFSLLSKIKSLQGPDRDAFLDDLLREVDNKTSFWTGFVYSRMTARFSRRSRRASLRRVLDFSTPAPDIESGRIDTDGDKQRRRRRTFVIVMQSLADLYGGTAEEELGTSKASMRGSVIASLERAARRDARASGTVQDDMSNRLPRGLETPKYTTVARRPSLQIRRYEPFSICSVAMNRPRPTNSADQTDAQISNPQLSGASSFGALAGYLFGKNQQQTAMKMTTPVLSQGEGEARKMSFVLPSDYWNSSDLANAPAPLEGSGVELEQDNGGERAVVMFGGFATTKDVYMRTKQLLEGLQRDSEWQVDPDDSSVSLAQYNDPFTPPWKRRNEVSIKVVPV